ncbi:MAG: hypothetical protein IT384_15210 [Deltaproteobacteria bacterium]|nr:hypothetical protein [Deltaproteobacteria bacterium]
MLPLVLALAAVQIEADDVAPADRVLIERLVREQVAEQASRPCAAPCTAEVRVRALGGPYRIRVRIERTLPQGTTRRGTADLPVGAHDAWARLLAPVIAELFPRPSSPAAPLPQGTALPDPEGSGPWPWLVLGASAASLGVGLAFGIDQAHLVREVEGGGLRVDELEPVVARIDRSATISLICLSAAIVGATAVLLLSIK